MPAITACGDTQVSLFPMAGRERPGLVQECTKTHEEVAARLARAADKAVDKTTLNRRGRQ